MAVYFCNKTQSNLLERCQDCLCGPAQERLPGRKSVITVDEKRIVQKNLNEYIGLDCVMSRASIDIIQRMLDAS